MEYIWSFIMANGWAALAALWPALLPNPLVHQVGIWTGTFFRRVLGQRKVYTHFRGSLYAFTSGIEAGLGE